MMPQKNSFQTVLKLKGLLSWKTGNFNLISKQLVLAENLAKYKGGGYFAVDGNLPLESILP